MASSFKVGHDPGKVFVLSNAHVLAFAGNLAARIGDDILEGTSGNTVIAELEAWSGLLSGESLTDAAIAQVNQPDDAEFSIVDLGRPRYDPAVRPFVGMPVRMRGAPGELITATVHRTQASQDHSLFIPMRGEMQVRFSDQLVIKYDTPRPALLSGYSGSAVVDENNHLLGLFWMGSRNFGLVCKIEHVFEEFQVNLAGNVAAVPASAASLAAPGDDTVDILAKTVWGEARGEPPEGREAVASVIVNRAARRPAAWWGSTIKEVCLKPWQFSLLERKRSEQGITRQRARNGRIRGDRENCAVGRRGQPDRPYRRSHSLPYSKHQSALVCKQATVCGNRRSQIL